METRREYSDETPILNRLVSISLQLIQLPVRMLHHNHRNLNSQMCEDSRRSSDCHILMRSYLIAFLLLFSAASSGCLVENPDPDPSTQMPGCYEGEPDTEPEECTIEIPAGNNTTSVDQNNTLPDNNNSSNQTNSTDDGNETEPGNGSEVNEVTYGAWEGDYAFPVNTLARELGGEWFEWSLHDNFNSSWNGTPEGLSNGTDEPWLLIEFLSTDCSHCWNAAGDMSSLHAQYGMKVDFLAFAVNFSSNDNFNATPEEVAAFQDKTSHNGCIGDQRDCADRPGEPHDWLYVDDRGQSAMYDFASRGTPMFVIIKPNGVVAWHQYQHDGDEGEDSESIIDALARFFPTE